MTPTPQDETVRAVAAKLTKAQQEWLISPQRLPNELSQIVAADPEWNECAELGLSEYWTDRLTPFGELIRAYLMEQSHD